MEIEKRLIFGLFHLDIENERLWRGEEARKLTFKSFAVLRYLGERPGRLVTKDELFGAVWPETVVEDVALATCIWEIRKALGDDPRKPQFLETVHRRGYRFIAPVTPTPPVHRSPFTVQGLKLEPTPDPQSPIPNFVGRETELAQLQRWFEKALQGERQIVFVTGEPGIGKTTLVEAFLERIASDPTLWIARGQCVAHYGVGEAYLPILEALKRLCREPGREHLITLFRQLAPTWLLQMPSLLDPTSRQELRRETVGTTRECMLRELTDVAGALTTETPLVLVLEDLHWGDYSTLDFLSHLAWRQEPARLLLIGTYRPVEVTASGHPLKIVKQELQTHGQCEELSLNFLSEAAVAEYLTTRFTVGAHGQQSSQAEAAPLRELARLVHQCTDGNPLFMVNVVNNLLAQGFIIQAEREWSIQGDLEVMKSRIPENLRQIIEQQIDRLSKEEQEALEAASVAGMEFSAAAVAAGLEIETIQAEERCEGLARRQQFLQSREFSEWPDGTVAACYGFIHALYHNVLYERITAGKRAQLHQQIGEREEKGYSDRVQEIAGELAVHFERGRDYRRVVQYLGQAAENAGQRGGYREATGHLTKGIALLKALPDTAKRTQQELVLQTRLGLALQVDKGVAAPEAERAYARARELCQQGGEPLQLFHLLRGLHSVHQVRGEWQKAHELAEQCLGLAQQLQDSALLIAAHSMLGTVLASLGELVPARAHIEQGIALYDPDKYPPLPGGSPSFATYYAMYCLVQVAPILLGLGYPDQALKRNQEALTLAQEQSHPYLLTLAVYGAAELHLIRQEWHLSRDRAEAVLSLATTHGFTQWIAMGTILRGAALAEQGQIAEGMAQIRQGLVAYQATGAECGQSFYLALLARAYRKAGQVEEGLTMVEEALAAACKNGQRLQEAWLYWLKGELTLQQCKVQGAKCKVDNPQLAAEECFRNAIATAQRQSAKWLELRATVSLSRLWQQQGKYAEARQMLAEIYGWFTEGFATVDLLEANVLLEQLS
ncbi:MAG: AAA family ATPase [Deltaproteobacteria bacterium]|nr:AAA family ATPase [Deltaproteobacteria bacterium]